MKKLLNNLWLSGKPPYRFSSQQTKNISDQYLAFKNQVPKEILRKPRSLLEVKRWKATEFRTFLFYLGPVVLKQNVPEEVYENFLCLHVSISLFSRNQNLLYSQQLIKHFIETFSILYGKENMSHNVHNLLHLADDVKAFGSIENFSAFPFENNMMFIKKLVRKGDKPLQQIINRISERTIIDFDSNSSNFSDTCKKEHSQGPVIDRSLDVKQYEQIYLNDFFLSLKEVDNCCMLKDKSVVVIKNVIVHDKNTKIIGQRFLVIENFYMSPCESSKLNIFLVSGLNVGLQSWDLSCIAHKCIKLNFKNKFVVFPLLHTIKPD